MKYAVFSDVHGNLPALDAFLHAVKESAHGYICLGDVVGYGPMNDACLERVSLLPNLIFLKGNHEQMFLDMDTSHCSAMASAFFMVSRRLFSRDDLLPVQEEFRLGTWKFCHSLKEDGAWLYPYDAEKTPALDSHLCIGHTHHQTKFEKGGFKLINVGSIGQNRSAKNVACWGLYDTAKDDITLCSAKYDPTPFLRAMLDGGYTEELVNYYRE